MRSTTTLILAAVAVATGASSVRADVSLPKIFGSRMVLQQQMPVTVWGWADPQEKVAVSIAAGDAKSAATAKTTADNKGNWKVVLPPLKADGKTYRVTVTGTNKIVLDDVLIGEVWIGSGQSNMEWQLRATHNAQKAIANAKHPKIRLFHVPKRQTKTPAKDVVASWKVCAPGNDVSRFSGVLYYFGTKLQKELNVPIGLINASWGGSPIEPWTVKGKSSGGMYNGLIAPIQPVAMRGVLWYQGETNVIRGNGYAYYGKMKDLINGWRKVWKRDFPFYFVQIAPWDNNRYAKGQLPNLWEAQAASLKIPKTGMVVTTDIVDNLRDIHPRNKHDVGYRLARWALARDYGKKDVIVSGPLYKSMKVNGGKIHLSFAHVGEGLKARDGKKLTEFQIAGEDGKFVPANAVIDGNTVVVSSQTVPSPAHVQFGWHRTAQPNLVNSAGLPASPFRTKNWRGGTAE